MKKHTIIAGALLATTAMPLQAATIFSGNDIGASAPGANATAAAAAFDAATSGLQTEDFESFTVVATTNGTSGPGYTISSTGFDTRSISPCALSLCGDNTTPGGEVFAYSNSANALLTFNFDNPVNAFGAYFGGLQTGSNSLDFGGNSAAINTTQNGGFAFVGFYDPNNTYSSVTVNIPFDLISVDDVRYGFVQSAIPEPGTWAMMILGFGLIGGAMRTRRRKVKINYA